MTLINDLGDDADLLLWSDEWLESERRIAATELDRCANELHAIHLAQRIKRALQQKNLVAVQELVMDADGDVRDILIRILKLPEAVRRANELYPHDSMVMANLIAQHYGWQTDGYDVDLYD